MQKSFWWLFYILTELSLRINHSTGDMTVITLCGFLILWLFPRRTCCLWRWAVFSITSASREPFRSSASTFTNPAVSGDDLLMRYKTTSHNPYLLILFNCLFCFDVCPSQTWLFISSCPSRTTSHQQRSPSGPTTEWWSGSDRWIWPSTPQTWEGAAFMEDWWWVVRDKGSGQDQSLDKVGYIYWSHWGNGLLWENRTIKPIMQIIITKIEGSIL